MAGGGIAQIEWMVAEYRITLAEAIWDTALTVPMVLMPVRDQRLHGTSGPSARLRAEMRKQNEVREWLECRFQITDEPVSEIGWRL